MILQMKISLRKRKKSERRKTLQISPQEKFCPSEELGEDDSFKLLLETLEHEEEQDIAEKSSNQHSDKSERPSSTKSATTSKSRAIFDDSPVTKNLSTE